MKKIFALMAFVGLMFISVSCKDNTPNEIEEVTVEESCEVPALDSTATLVIENAE